LQQAERVASWREVSRRLVHELKEPLFSLQVTLENLRRAREQTAERFDELFFESTTVLRAEVEVLKTIVARFGDFGKMPPPRLQAVNVNEAVRATLKTFESQFSAIGRPPVTPELYLDERAGRIQGDPELLRAALEAVVLRALETMPTGGTLTVRTLRKPGMVRVEMSDTGTGLAPEERARIFTSYYTNRQGGLGLATVQSIVSDHGGNMSVESAPGAGTTYRLDFVLAPATAVPELPSLPPAPPPVRRKLPAAPAEATTAAPVAGESYENAMRSEEM
jgi:two-component system, NtrC family, nitrogen regulation sensor histidine kinase NtrY